jgi:spore maturation protein B
MNNILVYLSDYAIPIVIFYIVLMGLQSKSEIFEDFLKGAKEGLSIVVELVPTLIGLMVGIGVMRASGVFELLVRLIRPMTDMISFPSELLPLVIIKMFSSSAATSLLLDVYKEFGVDSYLGRLASVMMSASETIFYTLAVYTSAGKIKKTRYIVPGGLFATLVGIICSVYLLTNVSM